MALLSFLIALLCLNFATAQSVCGGKCTFRFCKASGFDELRDKGTKILLRGPNTALAPYICKPGVSLGLVRETGEALVTPFGSGIKAVPISTWDPKGKVSPAYPANYFKLFKIQNLGGLQGLGRRPSQGNQNRFIDDDLCVELPVTKWDVLKEDGTVAQTVSSRDPKDCVSFRTTNPVVLIELQWSGSDDFDLSVEEPDGDVVSKANTKTEAGKLNNDIGVGACGIIPSGKENVLYRRGLPVERGEYLITVRQFNNCGFGPSSYRLRVIIDGKIIKEQSGTTDLDDNAVVTTLAFTY